MTKGVPLNHRIISIILFLFFLHELHKAAFSGQNSFESQSGDMASSKDSDAKKPLSACIIRRKAIDMKKTANAGASGKGFYAALSLSVAMVGAACWYA